VLLAVGRVLLQRVEVVAAAHDPRVGDGVVRVTVP
jgi:hypothetical protein